MINNNKNTQKDTDELGLAVKNGILITCSNDKNWLDCNVVNLVGTVLNNDILRKTIKRENRWWINFQYVHNT